MAAAESVASEPEQEVLSLLDLQFVVKFSEECAPDQLRYLVHSLCPAIYGHELVKARSACAPSEVMRGMLKIHLPQQPSIAQEHGLDCYPCTAADESAEWAACLRGVPYLSLEP